MFMAIKWTVPSVIHFGPGSVLWGTTRNDYHYGTSYDDRMMGSEGADRFYAGHGNDIADYRYSPEAVTVLLDAREGGAPIARGGYAEGDLLFGVRSLVGSAFDDTFGGQSYAPGTFDGGRGYDTMTYQSMRSKEGVIIDFTQGADGEAQVDKGRNTDTLINIEKVVGTGHDDRFIADEHAADFDGGTGDDVADFSAMWDSTRYGIVVESDGGGYSVTSRNSGADYEITLTNVETIIGTEALDQFHGSDRPDHFQGGDGYDTFYLSQGADIYDGGDGIDILRGSDLVREVIDLGDGTGRGTGDAFGSLADGDRYIGIEDVHLDAVATTVFGSDDSNRLNVFGDWNHVNARGGVDRVEFAGDNGMVLLGDGDDILELGLTDNSIFVGGDGVDRLVLEYMHLELSWDTRTGLLIDLDGGTVTSLAPEHKFEFRISEFEQIGGTRGSDRFIDEDGTSAKYISHDFDRDMFVFEHRERDNEDVIFNFHVGEDIIDLSGSTVDDFDTLTIEDADEINSNNPLRDFMYQDGDDAVIVTNSDLGNSIRLEDVSVYDLSASDFIF